MTTKLTLSDLWNQQIIYNNRIKAIQKRTEAEWMINYILGAMSELGEILRETNWKTHRIQTSEEFGPNVAAELADLTKYVFSMWQLIGYRPDAVLEEVFLKGSILNKIYEQEMRDLPRGRQIIILDLDGVVANFMHGFRNWLINSQWSHLLSLPSKELSNFDIHIDLQNDWNYDEYKKAKIAFEKEGGYKNLPPIPEVIQSIQWLLGEGFYVIAYTARPYEKYKRIWSDTWSWLLQHNLHVNELHFGSEERISCAIHHSKENSIIAIEDNPILAKRYIISKIPVCLIDQPYNTQIENKIEEESYLVRVDPWNSNWILSKTIVHLGKLKHVR